MATTGDAYRVDMLPLTLDDALSLAEIEDLGKTYQLKWWVAVKSDGTWLPLTQQEVALVPPDAGRAALPEHLFVLSVFRDGLPLFHRTATAQAFVGGTAQDATPLLKMLARIP